MPDIPTHTHVTKAYEPNDLDLAITEQNARVHALQAALGYFRDVEWKNRLKSDLTKDEQRTVSPSDVIEVADEFEDYLKHGREAE